MQGAFGFRIRQNNRQKPDRAAALQPGQISQYVMRIRQESFFGAVRHNELKTFVTLNAGRGRAEVKDNTGIWASGSPVPDRIKSILGVRPSATLELRRWIAGSSPAMTEERRANHLASWVSALLELPEVGLAVEPELVAADRFLHRDVMDRLVERYDRHLLHAERDEVLHALVVLGGVVGEARAIDEPVHRLVLVGGDVEDRVVAVKVPEEIILRIVEPAAEAVEHHRQFLLVQGGAPVRSRNLLDGDANADLGQALLDQDSGGLANRRGADVEREAGVEALRQPGLLHQRLGAIEIGAVGGGLRPCRLLHGRSAAI